MAKQANPLNVIKSKDSKSYRLTLHWLLNFWTPEPDYISHKGPC